MRAMNCSSSVRPGTRVAGFTLLELLLAIAISAIAASVLYAGLAITFNARDAVVGELRTAGAGRSVLETMRADLVDAARPTGILAGAFIGEPGEDAHGRAADELSFFTNNRLMPADEPMGELFAVRFGLVDAPDATDGPEGHNVGGLVPARWLVREVRTNLLAPVEEQPAVQVLARRIWSLQMRYHDGDNWQETWNSTTRGDALPAAVELVMRQLPERVDPSASPFELAEQTVEVRRTFYLLKGDRHGAGQGTGQGQGR